PTTGRRKLQRIRTLVGGRSAKGFGFLERSKGVISRPPRSETPAIRTLDHRRPLRFMPVPEWSFLDHPTLQLSCHPVTGSAMTTDGCQVGDALGEWTVNAPIE